MASDDLKRSGGEIGSTGAPGHDGGGTGALHELAAAGQVGELARQLAEAAEVYQGVARRIADEMRGLASAPMTSAAVGGAQDLAHAWTEWLSRTMHTNARFAREALGARSLPEVAQVHARFVEEGLSVLRDGRARVLEAAVGGPAQRAALERQPNDVEQNAREQPLTVADVMTTAVQTVGPEQSVQEAAAEMARADLGVLPVVGEEEQILGMLTDRDLAVRVVAAGKDPARTKVREAMTPGADYCLGHAEVEGVAARMAELKVRRLPVLDAERRRIVGIVSLGDLATDQPDPELAGRALGGIAQEGGPHRQQPVSPRKPAATAAERPQRRR